MGLGSETGADDAIGRNLVVVADLNRQEDVHRRAASANGDAEVEGSFFTLA
jgi:hypothetical protein